MKGGMNSKKNLKMPPEKKVADSMNPYAKIKLKQPFKIKMKTWPFWLLLVSAFLQACGMRHSAPSFRGPAIQVPQDTIIMVSPVIRYENLYKEERNITEEVLHRKLLDAYKEKVRSIVTQKGFNVEESYIKVKGPLNLNTNSANKYSSYTFSIDEVAHFLIEFSKGYVSPKGQILLQQNCPSQNYLLLALSLKFHHGEGVSWNPNTGELRPSTHKTCLFAGLIDCSSNEVIWKNSIILRGIPNKPNDDFNETIDVLFANFPESTRRGYE